MYNILRNGANAWKSLIQDHINRGAICEKKNPFPAVHALMEELNIPGSLYEPLWKAPATSH